MFSQVGKCQSVHARIVRTWSLAIEHCSKPLYDDLRVDATNNITTTLLKTHRDAFERWNEAADANRPLFDELMEEKVHPVAKANHLPAAFVDTVRWDLSYLLMEAEYSNLLRPGFFTGLSYWYSTGFFPCGWEGVHPAGRVIVF
jgi:hypothetical protein